MWCNFFFFKVNGGLLLCRSWFLGQVDFKGGVICTFFPKVYEVYIYAHLQTAKAIHKGCWGTHSGFFSIFTWESMEVQSLHMIPVTRIKKYGMCMGARLLTQQVNNPHGLHFPQETVKLERNLCIRAGQPLMRLKREVAKSQLPSRKPSQRRRKNRGRERD